MSRLTKTVGAVLVLAIGSIATATAKADNRSASFAVTMTNDSTSNAVQVYDVNTHALLQTLPTQGKGGVGGNARGIKQFHGRLIAAVNNGSNTVTLFRRDGNSLRFERIVTTSSAPVSIDFGNDHMYVAGATTVDSFTMHQDTVGWLDGTTSLQLAAGGVPANGSTAQVGVINKDRLLVTIKTDPDPGTVDVVALDHGAVTGAVPVAVSAPAGTLTPFGFSVYPDETALITLAHSNQVGLFRDGGFNAVIAPGQAAPCWTTRVGKYVFTANTGSKTISRLVGTGNHVFVDSVMAASVTAGGAPSDIDAVGGVLAVLDRGAGQAHLTLFAYNAYGELTASGSPIALGAPNANGVAIVGRDQQ